MQHCLLSFGGAVKRGEEGGDVHSSSINDNGVYGEQPLALPGLLTILMLTLCVLDDDAEKSY